MAATSALSKLKKAVRARREIKLEHHARRLRENVLPFVRRRRVAERRIDRVLRAAAGGLESGRIQRLHDADDESCERLLKRQRVSAGKAAVQAAKRRAGDVRALRKLRGRYEYRIGNPMISACLWEADGVQSVLVDGSTGDFTVREEKTGFGNNVWRGECEADSEQTMIGVVWHQFTWEPDARYTMQVTSVSSIDGVGSIRTRPTCIGANIGEYTILQQTTVSQFLGSTLVEYPSENREVSNLLLGGGCFGRTGSDILSEDDHVVLAIPAFPVLPDSPMMVTVATILIAWAEGRGSSTLDLWSDPAFGIRVPVIWLRGEGY